MSLVLTNNAKSLLVGAINSVATSFTITGGTGVLFPSTISGDVFHASLVDSSNNIEIIKVTNRATDIFTIVRGQEGTTARSYAVGDAVRLTMTAEAFNSKANQAELDSVIADADTLAAALTAHIVDAVDAHDASAISYAGGTGMSATDVEAALDELAAEKMDKTGGTFTGPITLNASSILTLLAGFTPAEGAEVVAAATTNIWALDGNTRHITGSTGITSFATAPQPGAVMRLIFDGTPLITASANLILNSDEATVQMQAGDWADVYADTTTQFRCVVHRKTGRAVTFDDPPESIGEGQTWQNVSASRSFGVSYTNTSGRPIMVSACGTGQPNAGVIIAVVGGVTLGQQGVASVASAAMYATLSFIVPNGVTYSVSNFNGASKTFWAELR